MPNSSLYQRSLECKSTFVATATQALSPDHSLTDQEYKCALSSDEFLNFHPSGDHSKIEVSLHSLERAETRNRLFLLLIW